MTQSCCRKSERFGPFPVSKGIPAHQEEAPPLVFAGEEGHRPTDGSSPSSAPASWDTPPNSGNRPSASSFPFRLLQEALPLVLKVPQTGPSLLPHRDPKAGISPSLPQSLAPSPHGDPSSSGYQPPTLHRYPISSGSQFCILHRDPSSLRS